MIAQLPAKARLLLAACRLLLPAAGWARGSLQLAGTGPVTFAAQKQPLLHSLSGPLLITPPKPHTKCRRHCTQVSKRNGPLDLFDSK